MITFLAFGNLPERLHDFRDVLGSDANSRIGDPNNHTVAFHMFRTSRDLAAIRCELDGVR